MAESRDVTLLIDPFTHHFEGDALFDPATEKFNGDDILAPYIHLREWFGARGVKVHTADRLLKGEVGGGTNVCVSFGMQKRYHALAKRGDCTLSAFFAFESPVVDPVMYRRMPDVQRHFKRVYSFSDSEALSYFLPEPIAFRPFVLPYPTDRVREDVWRRKDRQFLVMINRNKLPAVFWNELYTERMRAIEFFARTNEIDLYGKGWDAPSYQMGIGWVPGTVQKLYRAFQTRWQRIRPVPLLEAARKVFKGTVDSKIETLGHYTFSLCFDNVILKGWVTEKIFDCFVAGNIPVYWGAPDIQDYVPAECFIDMRRFKDYQELRDHLRSMSEREIEGYREAARDFMRSPKFRPFTKQAFTEVLAGIVEEDTGVRL